MSDTLAERLTEFLCYSGAATEWTCTAMARGPKGTQRSEGSNSVFKVDCDPETDPIAATMLQLLLEACDPTEVDWGTRQPPNEVLEMLQEFEAEPRLLGDRSEERERDEREGESLFERVLEAVHAASEDLERGMELKEAIQEASPQARAWMEHVVRNRVTSDAAVDAALGLDQSTADRVHREIEALLAELAE